MSINDIPSIWRAISAPGGGNILAFWRPWPPSESAEVEQENNYLLYGHLGGVMYLTTNTLGDTLVSVGQDRVAKLWRAPPQTNHSSLTVTVLQPVRQGLIFFPLAWWWLGGGGCIEQLPGQV